MFNGSQEFLSALVKEAGGAEALFPLGAHVHTGFLSGWKKSRRKNFFHSPPFPAKKGVVYKILTSAVSHRRILETQKVPQLKKKLLFPSNLTISDTHGATTQQVCFIVEV